MKKESVSVVVIGSGISGFTSAVKLIENGFSNVTVLEAENRIGGRIFTTEFSDGLVDLGAQWCHGINNNVVYELAGEESFSETVMDFSKMTFCRSDGLKTDGTICEVLMQLCNEALEEIKTETDENVDEILTKQFFEALKAKELIGFDKNLAYEVLENFKKRESSYCGCEELVQISSSGFNKFKDCAGPTWLNWKGKGYKSIFDKVLVMFWKISNDFLKFIL